MAEMSFYHFRRLAGSLRRWLGTSSSLFLSQVLVLGLLAAYLGVWLSLNWPMLTDVRLQNDDARTILFPFHRYGPEGALADDPIASEMLDLVPIGVRLLYMVFVPLSDLFVAAKLVQAVAMSVLVWAAVILARSRRAGVGAAALLLFLFLHDWFAINRIAGGLPRAFGFPCFALWVAGVLGNSRVARLSAPVIAAVTYPSVMNMILAAEGLFTLRGVGRIQWGVVLRRLKRYAILVAVCLVAVLPAVVGGEERGPIHTLEQAQEEPAFGKRGRLWILPFAKPTDAMGDAFIDSFRPRGGSPMEDLKQLFDEDADMYALLLFALISCLPLLRIGPPPWMALSFVCGAIILYWASRVFAFRLYSPERYYSFGMRMAALLLVSACVGHVFHWMRPHLRTPLRNLVCAFAIFGIWACTGNGVVRNNGMTIDQRTDRKLYEFIAELPKDVRFASHILDGDGIPFYSARATMGGFETLQPWFVGSWQRQKDRTEGTLNALYATDPRDVFDYADQNDVTHFLINRHRYGQRMKKHAGSFEPFSSYVNKLLRGKRPDAMIFDDVPKEAVIFQSRRYQVVSVEKLRRALTERSDGGTHAEEDEPEAAGFRGAPDRHGAIRPKEN